MRHPSERPHRAMDRKRIHVQAKQKIQAGVEFDLEGNRSKGWRVYDPQVSA